MLGPVPTPRSNSGRKKAPRGVLAPSPGVVGRPRKNARDLRQEKGRAGMVVRLPSAVLAAVERAAAVEHRDRTNQIIAIVEAWLKVPHPKAARARAIVEMESDQTQRKTVLLRMPVELVDQLNQLAEAEGRFRERQLEIALREWLEKRA